MHGSMHRRMKAFKHVQQKEVAISGLPSSQVVPPTRVPITGPPQCSRVILGGAYTVPQEGEMRK